VAQGNRQKHLVFKAIIVALKVVYRISYDFYIILKPAKSRVATCAQKTSNFSCGVVVIYAEAAILCAVSRGLIGFADGASSTLNLKHSIIVVDADAKLAAIYAIPN
jgi:hypothetical protein